VNVTFIADRSTQLGFKVYPDGAPITEEAIKDRPMLVVCGKQEQH
jgi:hypothetical protein